MNNFLSLPPIIAQVATRVADAADALSQTASEKTFEFARLRQFEDERVLIAVLVGVGLLVFGYVVAMYRRDSVELPRGIGMVLSLLRLFAFACLFVFFLKPEMRVDHKVIRDSRVLILADVSQSMGLSDSSISEDTALASDGINLPRGKSRSDQVIEIFTTGKLQQSLQEKHEVVVSRFDASVERLTSLPHVNSDKKENEQEAPATGTSPEKGGEETKKQPFDWKESLTPRGDETRLGRAIQDALQQNRNAPLAGIIVLTDGGHNAGIEIESALAPAVAENIPIFTVGVGSSKIRRNVRISDFVVPTRAYPGDASKTTIYVQSSGFGGRMVDVELYRRDGNNAEAPFTLVASERVALGPDGEVLAVPFEFEEEKPGRVTLEARLIPPSGDSNTSDNVQHADVDVVDRQLRVLLLAGGATREYRFLRNQLKRDKGMTVDVLLQSAPSGISQDANEVLTQFPQTEEELFEYDCIVAFDADWLALDIQKIEMIEKWVSKEAGGLMLIAGPVHSGNWIDSSEHSKLKSLFPVTFRRGLSLLGEGRYGSKTAWPLDFTREGKQADFLQIGESPSESSEAWNDFNGVFGYFTVKGAKPGATTYAHFSDPEAMIGTSKPVYMAGQFFGSGRVFYMGSGEMWRLRAVAVEHFEVFYTKLLRHLTQGRLLRGSNRGLILLESDRYMLGDTVVVRAQLKDEKHDPLTVRSVDTHILLPDNRTTTTRLTQVKDQPGHYMGQLRVLQEGAYGLTVLSGAADVPTTKRFQVRLPDLERKHPELNEELLGTIASKTGGLYYTSLAAAVEGSEGLPSLAESIESREEVDIIRGAPDQDFQKRLMQWALAGLVGSLCLEWLCRRLFRLA